MHTTQREAFIQEKSTGLSGETVRAWHFGHFGWAAAYPTWPLCAAGQSMNAKNSAAWPEVAILNKNPRSRGTFKSNSYLSTKRVGKANLSTSLRLWYELGQRQTSQKFNKIQEQKS